MHKKSIKMLLGTMLFFLIAAAMPSYAGEADSSQSYLHAALRLSTAQEDAWKSYAQQRQAILAEAPAAPSQDELTKMTTVARLQAQYEYTQKRLNTLEKLLVVVKVFYAALTPQQQKTFDTINASDVRDPGMPLGKGGTRVG